MKILNLFAPAFFFFIGLNAVANGDPVTRYSSINRLGNPEPVSLPEVKIESEKILIRHVDGYNCFDITYRLKNTADTAIHDIDYGFPVDYSVRDEKESYYMADEYETESMYEVGWNEKLIKDVSFSLDSHPLPFEIARTSVVALKSEFVDYTEYGGDTIWSDGINRRWFYTRFSLPADTVVELNVKYKVYANSVSGLYERLTYNRYPLNSEDTYPTPSALDRYFSTEFLILYDFTPAKYFGDGLSFPIDVEIDLSNLKNPKYWGAPDGTKSIVKKRFDFDGRKEMKLVEYITYEKDDYRKELGNFENDPSQYKLKTSDGMTTLEFDRPTNVTDVVCDVDDPQLRFIVGQVVYADGKVSTYIYERQSEPAFWSRQLEPTVVLIINDIYGAESCYWSFTDEKSFYLQSDSGVTAIRLFHGSTPLRDLRPLDARFLRGPALPEYSDKF